VFAEFVAAAQHDPEFAENLRSRFLLERRAGVRLIWERGVQRGECRVDVDPEIALDFMYSLVVYRLLTGHAELSPTLADGIVDVAMNGLLQPAAESIPRSSRIA
jgi:hypothetical protein